MSRPPANNRLPTKDMYWFAHGGIESNDNFLNQRNSGEAEEDNIDCNAPRSLTDRRGLPDDQKYPVFSNSVGDGSGSSGPASLEMKGDTNRNIEKRMAAEERRKQMWEAEQERNDAVLRKRMEREAALEARRNASRSNISFAFGSSVPRNVESLAGGDSDKINRHSNAGGLIQREENHETLHYRRSVSPFNSSGHRLEVDGSSPRPQSPQSNHNYDRKAFSPPSWLVGSGALIGDDIMSRSMTAAVSAPRGRRKNDLMPTVPYDRTPAPKTSSSNSTRKRSVSMTRLDQLAQPRKHYLEANKASSTVSSGASSMLKDTIKSPTRPLSSASEQSGGSGRLGSSLVRRVRSSPRKPRPVSIAGTVPDHKIQAEAKLSPIKKTFAANKKQQAEVKKASPVASKPSSAKPVEKSKSFEKPKTAPRVTSAPKPSKPSTSTPKPTKQQPPQSKSSSSPKSPTAKKTVTNKKKADIMISSQASLEASAIEPQELAKSSTPPDSPPPENASADADRNNAKRIISEEEAKAGLAEKRRLAREQAEKEAELERQRQEELRLQEEERLRLEEEEQRRMEEEQLHLLEEHRRSEDEKLRKAIEENERKEEEERSKREEDLRLKAEQEKKAQEESEKQRIELEEKLRKEEEERAERKKRLEKIMSRTRGKTTGSSPSGSVSGSEQLDSSENQHENLSSGANSLDSNGPAEMASGPASLEAQDGKSEAVSDGASMEAHPTYEVASDNESLHDIIMPKSETASQDNSLVILPEKEDLKASVAELLVESTQAIDAVLPVCAAQQFEAETVSNVEFSALTPSASEGNKDKSNENSTSEEITDKSNENVEKNISEMTGDQVNVSEVSFDKYQSDSVEVQEVVSCSEAPLVESSAAKTFEIAAVDHSEVILSFEDGNNAVTEIIDSASMVQPQVAQPPEEVILEAEMEQNLHFSTSSDIKLPDPIYENTSDEGSVSSEKHLQDGNNFGFQEEQHHESQHMLDEVFNEREVSYSEGSNFNPFESIKSSSASNFMAAYESQFEIGGMQDSIYDYETCDAPLPDAPLPDVTDAPFPDANDAHDPNFIEQPREVREENINPSRLSTSSVPDINGELDSKASVFPNVDENKENMQDAFNPFSTGANEFDAFSNKENIQLISDSAIIDNISMGKDVLPENLNVDNKTDNFFLQQESTIPEQINYDNQSFLNESSSDGFESSNVTIIKSEGSNDCIGIISSIDHDHISSDLTKQQNMQNELLKSNFECSIVTDSEDSSLDSNLSQVMTGEASENNSVGLYNGYSESTASLKNEQAANLFREPAMNGNTDSKSNGDHLFSETAIFSNGHRLESSPKLEQIGDYVPVLDGGKHISSVDHPKTNIFDSVGAVDFGKMSPDPFLAKGSPNPISGNPFLLQDEQKQQVLMTPDFFN